MTWADDDTIFYAVTGPDGLFSVPVGGGDPKLVAKPDPTRNEFGLHFPSALPGGRGLLVTLLTTTTVGQADTGQIVLLDPRTGERKVLVRGGAQAQYVESDISSMRRQDRCVRSFDLKRLDVTGAPVPVVDGVKYTVTGQAQYTVARNGTLIYVPGSNTVTGAQSSLVWGRPAGREEPLPAPPRAYIYPRISPDGTRLALDVRDRENDIWIWDLKRQTMSRLTLRSWPDRAPVWTPDGRRVIFSSQRGGLTNGGNIFWQAADGTGTVERLTTSDYAQFTSSVSPDGTRLVFREDTANSRRDISMVALDRSRKIESLIRTMFDEENARGLS